VGAQKKINFYVLLLICFLFTVICCERSSGVGIRDDRDLFFWLRFENNDEMYEYLKAWEIREPNNLDVYYHFSMYYHVKSIRTILHSEEEAKEITGTIYYTVENNKEDMLKAIEYIDRGLSLYPNRLDFHFDRIRFLIHMDEYLLAIDSFNSLIELSKKINNKWIMFGNRKMGRKAFLNLFQSNYTMMLVDINYELLQDVKLLLENLYNNYPNSVYSHYNLAIYYKKINNYQEAFKYLLQAEKIDKNYIYVNIELGLHYFKIGNLQKANDYVEKVKRIGGGSYMSFFREYLD